MVDQRTEEVALRLVNDAFVVVAFGNEATAAEEAFVGAGVTVKRTSVLVEVSVVDRVMLAVVLAEAIGAGGVPHSVSETYTVVVSTSIVSEVMTEGVVAGTSGELSGVPERS